MDCENLAASSSKQSMCLMCGVSEARYTCPRCNVLYCSLACYQSTSHSECSEAFYQDQVVTELALQSSQNDVENRQRMEEILVKLHKEEPADQADLDSDDTDDDGIVDDDIVTRLAGVDLDDADAVWQRLSKGEQADFEKLLKTGGITALLPTFTPWWERTSKLIQEVKNPIEENTSTTTSECESNFETPSVVCVQDICKKPVSPCLLYNIANIIAAYAFTVRCFNGEHIDWPSHAAFIVWNLSGCLSRDQNYSNIQDALICASTSAIQKEGASQEDVSTLQDDAQCIVSCDSFLPAALSDLLLLFRAAVRHRPSTAKGPFSQRFCDGTDCQVPKDKLKLGVKKLEFMLSWVLFKKNSSFDS